MMTENQQAVLDFIAAYQAEHGIAPTYREIVAGTAISSPGWVCRIVSQLEKRGFVRRLPGKHRAIEILRHEDTLQRAGQRIDDLRGAILTACIMCSRSEELNADEVVEMHNLLYSALERDIA